MTFDVGIAISIIAALVAVASFFINNKRADKKDLSKDIAEKTSIMVKIDTISMNVSEIKNDIKDIKNDMQGLKDRLIIVEQSTKSAHRRLDVMEERVNRFIMPEANKE